MCSESCGNIQQLRGQFLYPERGRKNRNFLTPSPSSCPRSYSMPPNWKYPTIYSAHLPKIGQLEGEEKKKVHWAKFLKRHSSKSI